MTPHKTREARREELTNLLTFPGGQARLISMCREACNLPPRALQPATPASEMVEAILKCEPGQHAEN
jgi:hypothetical protein